MLVSYPLNAGQCWLVFLISDYIMLLILLVSFPHYCWLILTTCSYIPICIYIYICICIYVYIYMYQCIYVYIYIYLYWYYIYWYIPVISLSYFHMFPVLGSFQSTDGDRDRPEAVPQREQTEQRRSAVCGTEMAEGWWFHDIPSGND